MQVAGLRRRVLRRGYQGIRSMCRCSSRAAGLLPRLSAGR
eukprot:COSAG06_NODE_66176_length_255_cov_0.641026_1_plen_39_part_10